MVDLESPDFGMSKIVFCAVAVSAFGYFPPDSPNTIRYAQSLWQVVGFTEVSIVWIVSSLEFL